METKSMNSLYSNLSEIYESMYQTFINYEDEFLFYSSILKNYQCQSVLEAGCGTGNLAHRFTVSDVDYVGMDLSDDMLTIARKNNPTVDFIKGDMRNFNLKIATASCIITGRSISYLITDEDVNNAFHSIYKNLTDPGVLCFDFIDASLFLPSIKNGKSIIHWATVGNKRFQRKSFWKVNQVHAGTFDWLSIFYEEQIDGSLKKIGEDQSTIRTFEKNEMKTFLQDSGYKVENIIPRPSYAFDTLVLVAKKK
jgi:SAM-dependent methyltransferase